MKNIIKLIVSSLLMLSVVGCANKSDMKVISASKVGCLPKNISIEDNNVGVSTASWTAKCKDKTYYCSGDDMMRNISCKQLNK